MKHALTIVGGPRDGASQEMAWDDAPPALFVMECLPGSPPEGTPVEYHSVHFVRADGSEHWYYVRSGLSLLAIGGPDGPPLGVE